MLISFNEIEKNQNFLKNPHFFHGRTALGGNAFSLLPQVEEGTPESRGFTEKTGSMPDFFTLYIGSFI